MKLTKGEQISLFLQCEGKMKVQLFWVFLITRSGTCYDVIALILIDCLHVSDQGGTNNVGLQCEGKIIVHFERPNVHVTLNSSFSLSS